MSTVSSPILKVAIPSPLPGYFDYLPPAGVSTEQLKIGVRVKISFGRRILVGIIARIEKKSKLEPSRLKPIITILDEEPLFNESFIKLCEWVSEYYHYSIGEILNNALPVNLRRDIPAEKPGKIAWRLTSVHESLLPTIKRNLRHKNLLELLQQNPDGLTECDLLAKGFTHQMIYYLARHDRIEPITLYPVNEENQIVSAVIPPLNEEQHNAVENIKKDLNNFQTFLLDGITGSGKTEVYFHVINEVLKAGKQALILVPEISLTPQTIARFSKRFNVNIVCLHSALSHRQRTLSWLSAKHGTAQIVIGTRSAIFTPMNNLGLIIVDEEHDISFKQQDSFRYSARDVGIKRAQLENIPIILGSATPSFESLFNAKMERYQLLRLTKRAGVANPPDFRVIDIRRKKLDEGMSPELLKEMQRHLTQGNQVLLFLNRRGFSPLLICHDCGWVANCAQCDAHYTMHWKNQRLRCHHCDHEKIIPAFCPECKSASLLPLGNGTERIELALERHFADYPIIRMDRDNTRKKGALDNLLNQVQKGEPCILIGTQMLAKGHHFPKVTLVGILDADSGLFSIDFRTTERIAQLIVQVSGRAGRSDTAGEVLIQTRHPEHPLLQQLITQGYGQFAEVALQERKSVGLPPYGYIALIRAESAIQNQPLNFLRMVAELSERFGAKDVQILGPVPAPMERRAGRYRLQLLLQTKQRKTLQQLLKQLTSEIGSMKIVRGLRWSLDVDPQEMY